MHLENLQEKIARISDLKIRMEVEIAPKRRIQIGLRIDIKIFE